jgi:hypothetical protein
VHTVLSEYDETTLYINCNKPIERTHNVHTDLVLANTCKKRVAMPPLASLHLSFSQHNTTQASRLISSHCNKQRHPVHINIVKPHAKKRVEEARTATEKAVSSKSSACQSDIPERPARKLVCELAFDTVLPPKDITVRFGCLLDRSPINVVYLYLFP